VQIANKGYEKALKENHEIAGGMNLIHGAVVNKAVAESLEMSYEDLSRF
jgi:alanine dehydrogenase